MVWLQANWHVLVVVALGVSESLAQIDAIKANSIFQLLTGALKALAGK